MNRQLIAGSIALMLIGCSKPATTTTPVRSLTPVKVSASATATVTTVAAPHSKVDVTTLEQDYTRAKDMIAKVTVLNQIPDLEAASAVSLLGRLFDQEQDTEIREEIVYSLLDIQGQTQAKLDFLTVALQPNQPASVRLAAVDSLVELGHRDAIPILQNFMTDPNEEVRAAIEQAVDQLKPEN